MFCEISMCIFVEKGHTLMEKQIKILELQHYSFSEMESAISTMNLTVHGGEAAVSVIVSLAAQRRTRNQNKKDLKWF